MDARRSVKIIHDLGQAACHPIDLCHPEDRSYVEAATGALASGGGMDVQYRLVRPVGGDR